MHVRDSCLSLKEMSTNAEKETLYIQYGQLLLFQWYLLYDEEFEDTKRVIRTRKPKNRQHNGQKEKGQKEKQRYTNITHKTKDRVTRTPLKTGDEIRCSGMESSSCSTSGAGRVTLVTNLVISHE